MYGIFTSIGPKKSSSLKGKFIPAPWFAYVGYTPGNIKDPELGRPKKNYDLFTWLASATHGVSHSVIDPISHDNFPGGVMVMQQWIRRMSHWFAGVIGDIKFQHVSTSQ